MNPWESLQSFRHYTAACQTIKKQRDTVIASDVAHRRILYQMVGEINRGETERYSRMVSIDSAFSVKKKEKRGQPVAIDLGLNLGNAVTAWDDAAESSHGP
jgi:hypothetical protein